MGMRDIEVDMSDSFLVHYILNSLPPPYGPFRISGNTHKDKWSINKLMTMCVQIEESLAMETSEVVLTTNVGNNMNQVNKNGKVNIPPQVGIKKVQVFLLQKQRTQIQG